MKVIVNRKIAIWVQDEYDVPEGTTEEQLKQMDKTEELEDYFVERDMFKFMEAGGEDETLESEYVINPDEE